MRTYAVTFQTVDGLGRMPFTMSNTGQLAVFRTSEKAHEALIEILSDSSIRSHARKTIRVDILDLINPK